VSGYPVLLQMLKSFGLPGLLLVLAGHPNTLGADDIRKSNPGVQPPSAPLPLEPIYRVRSAGGRERFATRPEHDFKDLALEGIAFFAVCTNSWPTGLVPIFMVERTNRFELRRRPVRGQENDFEPLFFALPPADEPDAAKIAGHWDARAVRGNGDKDFPAWDLSIEGEQVSGRFDPFTQYRFAHLAGGTFRSNRLELRAEYNNEVYLLNGEWREGRINGWWQHVDATERGTWEATRRESRPPVSNEVVALYEWRRPSDNGRRYALEGAEMGAGWERSGRPLCQVWRGLE
jgi:hypothetical protein